MGLDATFDRFVLDVEGFDLLLSALADRGYRVIGPTVRDGAIVYDDIEHVDDLPAGWGDDQEAGTYRLRHRDDTALFQYAVGPDSPRRFLSPPRRTLWSATRTDAGFEIDARTPDPVPIAFVGLRGCDLAAIAVQDRVLVHGPYPDVDYVTTRERAFIVAVNCTAPAATCFCASMGCGPTAGPGYDLALTELLEGGDHRFVGVVGSARGAEILEVVPRRLPTDSEIADASELVERSANSMRRHLDPKAARDLLARNLEHPQWDDVAQRCLSCANCTLVCPTCFCSSVEDVTDLAGQHAVRIQSWGSCFTLDHSYLHGGSVRGDVRARYRQWLTHKLSTWWDQFDVSGCVGCGRCITWCPAGIDLTAEVAAIARDPKRSREE